MANDRVYNFSAGPSMLPLEVLQRAGAEITSEWFVWYGLKMGLSLAETLTVPLSLLLDLIAVDQIKHDGFKQKKTQRQNDRELEMILSLK